MEDGTLHTTLLSRVNPVTVALLFCACPVARGQNVSEMERAVREFQVLTAQMGARADGTRPARSRPAAHPKWHGRLYENFRNDFLDAVPHEIRQRGSRKSLLRRNQFGVNLSGPVALPGVLPPLGGTFFSFSYEGVRERISRTYLKTIPTVPERAGDFSRTVDESGRMRPIYDPASTRPNPVFDSSEPVSRENLQYQRDPFPENRIPAERLDATAAASMPLYPEPNASAGPFDKNNFFINSPETNLANGVIGTVEHTGGARQRFSVSFNYSDGKLGASRWFPRITNPGPGDSFSSTRRGSIEHVYTVSPQTINSAWFDASSVSAATGTAGDAFPVYSFSEYLGMGRATPFASTARNVFSFGDTLSMRKGAHSLRIAGQFTGQQVNTLADEYPEGYFRFSTGLSSLPGITGTGHSFGSFLLGQPEYAERTLTASPSYFRNSTASLWCSDQVEVGRNVTVTVYARLARRTPRVEKYDRQSTISLTAINPANDRPGALVAAGIDGAGRGFSEPVVDMDHSVGLTWTPGSNSKSLVRLSYAQSHGGIPIYSGQWGTQGFNTRQTAVSPNTQLEPALNLGTGFAPAPPVPDLSPDAANGTVADLADNTGRGPLYTSASIALEREMPGSIAVTLSFGHAAGSNLLVGTSAANPNAIPLDALKYRERLNDEVFNSLLRPYPQFKGFDVGGLYPLGRYQREAGTVKLEKRVSKGLSLSAVFERSKQMDDYSGPYGTQDYYNRANEWSLTPWNRPEYLQFSYVYELPFGANHALFDYRDWRRHLYSGWSVSGAGSYLGGLPLALRPLYNNTGGVVSALHVNAVPGVEAAVEDPGPDRWFNPAAFEQPADFTIGDLSRTHPALRGPSAQNYDLSLNKRMPVGMEGVVELSAAAFNFLNHAGWNDPDVTIGPAEAPNLNAGKIIGSHGGRVVQLGLRFSF